MKATIIKSLSNKKKEIEVKEGQTISEALGNEINISSAVMAVNGHKVNPDYKIKAGDILTIREIPEGVTAAIATLVFVGVAAGMVGGCLLLQNKWAQEAQERELEKLKKMSNNPAIDNRPFIRGASNTIAAGNSQPYIIGRHLFTPYLSCPYFYEITGEDGLDQYIYINLQAGFNKQVIKEISTEDVIIKKFTDTTAQQGPFIFDPSIFAEGEGEIIQDGSLYKKIPRLNYKHTCRNLNAEVPRDETVAAGEKEYLTFTLDENAKDVELVLSFPYGLYTFDDNGDKVETEVTITPEYSLDGGKTFNSFFFNNNGVLTNTFTRNVADKELRFVAKMEFTPAQYSQLYANKQRTITCRVRSNGTKDSKIKNDAYILYCQSLCFDPNKSEEPAGTKPVGAGLAPCLNIEDRERAYCTSIGLKIKATKNNESKLRKINIITQGLARVVENGKWTKEKKETSNIAAWILEILTSSTHPASQIRDEEIDLESFKDFYNWCEQQQLNYNYVITTNKKKRDTLQQILSVAGGIVYKDIYGKYAVAADRPQENAVQVYNSQNIISVDHQKDFTRKIDGLRIKFINGENDLFKEDTYLLMKDGPDGEPLPLTADSLIRDVRLEGLTNFNQVVKYARRLMAIEELRPKTTTIKIGNEGVLFTPLSKILLQDSSLKIGLSNGSITGVTYLDGHLSQIKIDKPVTFQKKKKYGLIVNTYNNNTVVPIPVAVSGTGYTDTLFVQSKITPETFPKPEVNNLFSFGELNADGTFEKITSPFLIQNISRTGGDYTVELVDYNEAIYKEGKIPKYKPNITETPADAPAIPPAITGINGADGKDGLTIFMEKPALVYNADEAGAVRGQRTTNKIQIFQRGDPVDFTIGEIESPAGMVVTGQGKTVTIEATAGTSMAKEGVIKIPIIYRPILQKINYVDEVGNNYVDEVGDLYGEYIYSVEEARYNLFISYAKSIAGKTGEAGQRGETGATGTRAAKYYGIRTDAEGDPTGENFVIGDYYIQKETARIKQVTALPPYWAVIEPSSESGKALYYEHVNEITSLIKDLAENDPSKMFVNAYVQLLLADTAFIDYLGAKQIILDKEGSIKSENYQPDKAGTLLKADGYFESSNANIRGVLKANNFEFEVKAGNVLLGEAGETFSQIWILPQLRQRVFESVADGTLKVKAKYKYLTNYKDNNVPLKIKSTILIGNHMLFNKIVESTPVADVNKTEAVAYTYVAETVVDIKVGDIVFCHAEAQSSLESYNFETTIEIYTEKKNPALRALCGFYNQDLI